MSTKGRKVIWGGSIMGADIRAKGAREARERPSRKWTAPRPNRSAWKAMAAPRSRFRRSRSASTAAWGLEVECNSCKTKASLPLDAIRRPRDTPI